MTIQKDNNLEMELLLEKGNKTLLSELKEKARYIEIDKRTEFENHLLKFAQEIPDTTKRNILYEALVSLKTIWEQYRPEENLQEKFANAFKAEAYNEAAEFYKTLLKQGLDYLGKFKTGEGKIFPVTTKNDHRLLHFNKKEIVFYTLRLEELKKIPAPDSLTIIDVLAYVHDHSFSSNPAAAGNTKNEERPLWILLQAADGCKALVTTVVDSLFSIRRGHHLPVHNAVYLPPALKNARQFAFFKNHLLLICPRTIYRLSVEGKWEKWYMIGKTKNKITAFATAKEGFWVGHSNGDVIMLKDFLRVGNREKLKGFSEVIINIRNSERYVLVAGKTCLRIASQGAHAITGMINFPCPISQAAFLQGNLLLILLTNSLLLARDIDQGNVAWQINLEENYDDVLVFRDYVYCGQRSGKTLLFEFPRFHTMKKALESKYILVEEQASAPDPNAPVRNISDFVGRYDILETIKQKSPHHFLLYGEARAGKTSLLNVLRDALSENARCCVIDMEQMLKETSSFEAFEPAFIDSCLQQHFIKRSELSQQTGYQALRSLINKVRRDRSFCVFCLDDFFIPEHFDENSREKFNKFFRSLLIHPDVRLMISCNPGSRDKLEIYIKDSRDMLKERKLVTMEIPFFPENEVKDGLRKKISLDQSVVDEIYKYSGCFPHLIHFFDNWTKGDSTVAEHAARIANSYGDEIFAYFRYLSPDARLLIATCLHENRLAEKVSYTIFYERFPFLRTILPIDRLKKMLNEIDQYGSGLSAASKRDSFEISITGNACFFPEAARTIPWIKAFKAIYEFTYVSSPANAANVLSTFVYITQSGLEAHDYFEKQREKSNERFYVNKLTDQGLIAFKMPKTTFAVLPLQPWQPDVYREAFEDLLTEFQEINRKAGVSRTFYILLFELHGTPKQAIREALSGLERVSIIDAWMMKNIIMANSAKNRASDYIFEQLSIRERSPYTTAGAVSDDLFFGRQMEIALIRGLPENIGVFGTRTIGKTSLLRKIHTAFKTQRKWKVFDLDCIRIESEKSLLKNLAEKMGIAYEEIPDIDKFRQYVTKDAETGGYSYLFLLDEVDRLVQYDMENDEKIFNTFNRLCNEAMENRETAVRFILFGFQQMFEQMKNPLSRLYNFMVFMPLKPLDMEGAMALVTRPMEKIQVSWKDKKDAEYLVDRCSGHPRLLQTACHALLSKLDEKEKNRDIIERADVQQALSAPGFLDICMRFYQSDYRGAGGTKETDAKKTFLQRLKKRGRGVSENTAETESRQEREFLGDIHRITILAAVRMLIEEGKDIFTIKEIQDELKNKGINASPDKMRNILDRLCLSGNFRLRDASTLLAEDDKKIIEEARKLAVKSPELSVVHPGEYKHSETTIPRFTYEFGVKIYPELLLAHFGGLDQCREEQKKLIQKGKWKAWIES
jgi:Cdc6-like AAA superfamily ATPase